MRQKCGDALSTRALIETEDMKKYLVLGLMAFMTPLAGQEELGLERVAILGGADLPFEYGSGVSLGVLTDGRYVTSGAMTDGALPIFRADGRFDRIVGRASPGPGEFRSVREVGLMHDTVYVLQSGNLVTRLGPDLRYVERFVFTTPTPAGWTILENGDLAVVGVHLGGPPSNRVHILRPDGSVRTSLARAPRAYDRRQDYNEAVGVITESRRYGGVWYGKWNAYELQLFVGGRLTKTVTRDAEWFAPWEGPEVGGMPRRPTIEAVAERPDGLLLVVLTVADPSWRPSSRRPGEGQRPTQLPRRAMWDSIVEIVDPETGEALASMRSDSYLRSPVGGDGTVLYTAREDDIGRYRLYVYQVHFNDGGTR
jgi:hypothetical protein